MSYKNFVITREGLEMDGAFIAPFWPQVRQKRKIWRCDGKFIKEYDIYVKLASGRELDTFTFTSFRNIQYSEYWDECCDAELSPGAKQALSIFLQYDIMKQEYRECYEVEKLGLYDGEPTIFVYGYKRVVAPDGVNIIYSEKIPRYIPGEREWNIKELLCFAEKLIKLRPGMSDLFFIIRLLAVLSPLFEKAGYPVHFFAGIFGESGTLKTTIARLFFTQQNARFLSFSNCSKKQIMQCIQQYSGRVVVIDDYHPLAKKYDKEKQNSILDAIARNTDSGSGAFTFITGEFMEVCFSLQDRMIQIRVPRDEANGRILSKKLWELQNEKEMLDYLMYEFAKRVYSNFDNMKVFIQNLFLQKEDGRCVFRIERNIRFLVVALQVFEKCFPDIAEWQAENQLQESLKNVLETQKRHMELVRRMEHEIDWTREVYLMLSSGRVVKKYDFSCNSSATGEIIIKNDKVYITGMALEREMGKFLECSVRINDIAEHLSKTQVLEEDRSSARTKKVNETRYYVISRSRLELYYRNTVSTNK